LSGNYVTPIPVDSDDDSDLEDDEEYDLSPDEDELDDLYEDESEISDLDDEDELDDLEGRIEEITYHPNSWLLIASSNPGSSDERVDPTPKGQKRRLEDADEAPELVDTSKDDIDPSKLSKSQKKKLKKQKREEQENKGVNGSAEKKVQFASKLEQGPTATTKSPSAEPPKKPALTTPTVKPKREKATLTQGVVIEEHAVGTGQKAVNGTKLGIRYIGKLAKNGKEFDKNTKGKPFRFILGKGEVIKGIPELPFSCDLIADCVGWDIGLQGIRLGGERKIHIPAAAAYGSEAQPGIPSKSDLVFDVKCVSLD